ncbi:MAG: flagellar biosynthetic protein FliO [Hyphomonadaceae bacterium]
MNPLSILQALAALVFVLGLLLGGAWLLRKYGSRIGLRTGQVSQDLRVLEWRSLDMRRKLAVVRWGGKEHLLCLAPTGDMVIASRDAEPDFKPITPDDASNGSAG